MDSVREKVRIPGGAVTVVRAPGVPPAEDATRSLLRAVRQLDGGRSFVMGPGATATALWAARSGAEVTCWTENLAEAQTLSASFAEAGEAPPRLFVQADYTGLPLETFDVALVHLPRGREIQDETFAAASAVLRTGARLYFVGATREGVRSAIERAQETLGQVGVLARKGGHHACVARRPEGPFPLPEVRYQEQKVTLEKVPTRLFGTAGVFAPDRLDEGATSLIAALDVEPGKRILDLGCGTGAVALAALRQGGIVTAVDVSARAVESARRTLDANGYPGSDVRLSVGAEAVTGETFDVVVTNPPFHRGHKVDLEVVRLFVEDAAQVLRPGGRLYLVANAFLKYETELREHFEEVETVWENKRFRVWRGIR